MSVTPKKNLQTIRFNAKEIVVTVQDESGRMLSSRNIPASLRKISADEIVKVFQHEWEFDHEAVTTRLICETDRYTCVPTSVFTADAADALLFYPLKPAKLEGVVLYNEVSTFSITNIFMVPSALYKAISTIFPQEPIEHHLTAFLKEEIRSFNENGVYIWVRKKKLDAIVVKNERIELINSYSYKTPEDFAYFTLNLYEQLSLAPDSCKLKLFSLNKNDEKVIILSQYLKNYEVR